MSQQEHRVYVIRHGETEWGLSGQHTGLTDIPQTENLRNRAKLLKPVLAGESFTLLLTSPLQRAREAFRLEGLGDPAKVEPDLVELNFGEYERITTEQIHEYSPELADLHRWLPRLRATRAGRGSGKSRLLDHVSDEGSAS
ncbi:MAG: histidine phosphatase family protein [Nitrospirales bacterium]